MRHSLPVWLLVALGVAACQKSGLAPSVPPPAAPEAPRYRLLASGPLPVTSVVVDSQLPTAPKEALRDGNLSTLWSNGPYRAPSASITLDLGAPARLEALTVKTPPTGASGSSYEVHTSPDGSAWQPVLTNQRNASWNLERKALPAGTSGRFVRWIWRNSSTNPEPRAMVFEIGLVGEGGAPGPSPSQGSSPSPGVGPSPAASPVPSPAPSVVAGTVPDPGPNAARGQALVDGKPVAGIALQLQGPTTVSVKTDASGYFTATNLKPGNYQGYFYNQTDRNKIGYWRSRPWPVSAKAGARIPPVDLYQVGMTNLPRMDARIGLPSTFTWVPQKQPVEKYWFRVHTRPYTSFQLFYQSVALPGGATTYTWDGSGNKLPFDPTNRYFWGVQWDAGVVGQGGNLYQAVYFNR